LLPVSVIRIIQGVRCTVVYYYYYYYYLAVIEFDIATNQIE